jgi:Ca-activated chloride channel homolog
MSPRWLIDSFERPMWLAVIPIVAALLAVMWVVARRVPVRLGPTIFQPKRSLSSIVLTLAIALFAVAAAGPRWGDAASVAIASGRDIVAVVDLSRSMTARDAMPDRIGRANELLQQLVTQIERRGGCRIAIVAFASQPITVCPLTYDLGHVGQKIATLTPDALPDVYAANGVSGTRIGAALTHAAELFAANHSSGSQILLFSDGDDPARDGEWRRALNLGVPIHVIALGNPERDMTMPGVTGASSRLQEGPLRELTSQTGGHYVADHNAVIDTSGFLSRMFTAPPQDNSEHVVSRVPAKPAPFLITGLLCLTLGLTGIRLRPTLATATALAIAAGPFDDWLRRGNAELATGRADSALTWYAKAAERTPDPGQVAFNQGIAKPSYISAVRCQTPKANVGPRRCLIWELAWYDAAAASNEKH